MLLNFTPLRRFYKYNQIKKRVPVIRFLNMHDFSKNQEKDKPAKKRLVEGQDYYVENRLFVFTEKYLRERGYCCQSGCRHCPYGFKKK